MNPAQQHAFDTIMAAIEQQHAGIKPAKHCFFLNGPGGTGKTFVYLRVLDACRELGALTIASASTGIASMNFQSGATVHSIFGLPSPLTRILSLGFSSSSVARSGWHSEP